MMFETMRIKLPNLSEGGKKIASTAYKKLSMPAQSLAKLMADLHNKNGQHRFNIDDLRGYGGLGGWRKIQDLLYELESRGFGRVTADGIQMYFEANVAAIQSI